MSNQQVQKVKVKRLAHVGIWTTDVSAQARFYHQVLGLEVRSTSENNGDDVEFEETNVFMTLDGESHCLGLFDDNRPAVNTRRPVQRSPLHHLSFEVDSDAELAALAARLKIAGVDLVLDARDGDPDLGDTLWFSDPDGNRVEISVQPDNLLTIPMRGRNSTWHPQSLQHIALYTLHLEAMVEFYTEALGFDISDWLLRERAWLRCNQNHHTLMFIHGNPGIDHIGFSILDGNELLRSADLLSQQQVPLLWGPGRHGTSGDLFIRFADPDGRHIELSAGIQQYYDRDVTAPPRLWHTREMALNLWGMLPAWIRDETQS
jgi:catechol 2,3-dioxygenase-like lactoylglutathione lyase family enzyme